MFCIDISVGHFSRLCTQVRKDGAVLCYRPQIRDCMWPVSPRLPPLNLAPRHYIYGETVSLNMFQPGRDPSTGWWCHSTGAGGPNQYWDICQDELCTGTRFTREHSCIRRHSCKFEGRVSSKMHDGCTRVRLQPCHGRTRQHFIRGFWHFTLVIAL